MKAVGGTDFDRVGRPLSRHSPDFRQLLIEQAYGELLPRPGLSLKARELVTVGVLCVAGNSPVALKYHCAGMLNTGWTPRQLIEIIIQASAYGGFHAAFHGIQLVREVLRERVDRPSARWSGCGSSGSDGGRLSQSACRTRCITRIRCLPRPGAADSGVRRQRIVDAAGARPERPSARHTRNGDGEKQPDRSRPEPAQKRASPVWLVPDRKPHRGPHADDGLSRLATETLVLVRLGSGGLGALRGGGPAGGPEGAADPVARAN